MILTVITAFIVSSAISLLLARTRGRWQILDIPNDRSLHAHPVPRTGGIALLAGLVAGLVTAWLWKGVVLISWPLTLAITLLAGIALIDDRHTLGAAPRLSMQVLAVCVLLLSAVSDPVDTLTVVTAGLFLLWMINLYNFMDGMDGFAGGMAVIGFGTYALLAWLAGDTGFALGCAIVAAAAAGFLLLNFPPAQLFMGDSGSTVLGLLAGVVILQAHTRGILSVWLGLLVFSPFIADASVTLISRLLRGEKVWLPHKTHYYQKLVEFGWGHKRTVLAEYTLMIACGGSAMAAATQSLWCQTVIIAGWALIYITLIYLIHRAAPRRGTQT